MDQKYKNLYVAWDNYIKNGKIDFNVVRPMIYRSWERCTQDNIEPFELKPVIGNKEKRRKNTLLEKTAEPYMEMVNKLTKNSGFIILLVDNKGYVLKLIGDDEVVQAAKKTYLIPGANRLESFAGTNAISLALTEKKPVQIFGPEHYNYHYHNWTCSAAPIKDADNGIIGVLNMSGHYSLIHKHTLGIVVSTVRAIERDLCLQKTHQSLLLANNYLEEVLNSVSDGLFAIDNNNKVVHVNEVAAKILQENKSKIVNKSIDETIGQTKYSKEFLNKVLLDKEVIINKGKAKFSCLLNNMPIKDGDNVLGSVVTLREKKKVHKLVHRFAGTTASYSFEDIIGESQPAKECVTISKTVAKTDCKILIEGESGVGKELFAQAIHNYGHRRNKPFVALNCSAIPSELFESELFGYEEGAFTGARKSGKPGKFELAEEGTLFLDEISNMSLEMQAKILRVLQEESLTRVGGTDSIPLNVRIIAATNRVLFKLVEENMFREDLYYRLSVVTIKIPALSERKDDIPLFVKHISKNVCNRTGKIINGFSDEFINALIQHDWPGNIRELENVIERAIILTKNSYLTKDSLPEYLRCETDQVLQTSSQANDKSLKRIEYEVIKKVLDETNGNVTQAAKVLGVSRNTVYNKLKGF